MISRMLQLPSLSCFLFGPRGIGKSTFLRHALGQSHDEVLTIDLLEGMLSTALLANPQRLAELIPSDFSGTVVIDEVQKVPQLLDEVHRLIETRGIRFVLTGSNARKLRQTQANMLAGRALTLTMHPFTAAELGDAFDLEKALAYGLLPSLYDEKKPDLDPVHYLQSYLQTYLREEVQQEGLTRNLEGFARFLEAASFSQAEVLNVSAIARECHIGRKSAESYFQILEDLLIAFTLPAFDKRAQRKVVQHPKFFFFDLGVYRALRPKGPLDNPEEIDGAALETLVIQHLRAFNDYQRLGFSFFYWRTRTGQEVDLVCYGERGLYAYEIKRSSRIDPRFLKGLQAFRQDYPMAQCSLIYGGDRRLQIDGIQVVPIAAFLRSLGSQRATP